MEAARTTKRTPLGQKWNRFGGDKEEVKDDQAEGETQCEFLVVKDIDYRKHTTFSNAADKEEVRETQNTGETNHTPNDNHHRSCNRGGYRNTAKKVMNVVRRSPKQTWTRYGENKEEIKEDLIEAEIKCEFLEGSDLGCGTNTNVSKKTTFGDQEETKENQSNTSEDENGHHISSNRDGFGNTVGKVRNVMRRPLKQTYSGSGWDKEEVKEDEIGSEMKYDFIEANNVNCRKNESVPKKVDFDEAEDVEENQDTSETNSTAEDMDDDHNEDASDSPDNEDENKGIGDGDKDDVSSNNICEIRRSNGVNKSLRVLFSQIAACGLVVVVVAWAYSVK